MPVSASVPPGVARPKANPWSNSPHLTPPGPDGCAWLGQLGYPSIPVRSITRPPLHTQLPDVMAAAAHRHQQTVGAGEVDRVDHVGDASAAER